MGSDKKKSNGHAFLYFRHKLVEIVGNGVIFSFPIFIGKVAKQDFWDY